MDQAKVDKLILCCVERGANTFAAILSAVPDRHKFYRIIDRRLQALRKKGALTYTRKAGWTKPR